jgi:hypothetical protein
MARFVFLTKTRWNEPPRLRHHLAELLARAGHEVLFFEKPGAPWKMPRERASPVKGIRLLECGELIHHRLRIGPVARAANALCASASISLALRDRGIGQDDVIVNFNDDFVTTSPRMLQGSLAKAQRMTCTGSDAVLTPSVVLQEQLSVHSPAELFLPWADVGYEQPPRSRDRNAIFYWGYIGRRLDFPLLERLAAELALSAPDMTIEFHGPVEGNAGSQPLFSRFANVRLLGAAKLAEIELDRMAASIIPYVRGVPEVDVIVMPNKAMQLLARGLPLLIAGMPRFETSSFVRRIDEGRAVDTINAVREGFDGMQEEIRAYVLEHSGQARLRQFLSIVDRCASRAFQTSIG